MLPLAPLLADLDAAVAQCDDPRAIDYFAQDTDYPFSPINELVKERLADLQPLVSSEPPARAERRVARRIVHQIAHVMAKRGVVPTKEHDVQGELHLALLAAFPDVVREPSVAQQTKVYKPDFGIPSIATAIEAKFLEDPKDVGTTRARRRPGRVVSPSAASASPTAPRQPVQARDLPILTSGTRRRHERRAGVGQRQGDVE